MMGEFHSGPANFIAQKLDFVGWHPWLLQIQHFLGQHGVMPSHAAFNFGMLQSSFICEATSFQRCAEMCQLECGNVGFTWMSKACRRLDRVNIALSYWKDWKGWSAIRLRQSQQIERRVKYLVHPLPFYHINFSVEWFVYWPFSPFCLKFLASEFRCQTNSPWIEICDPKDCEAKNPPGKKNGMHGCSLCSLWLW